MFPELKRSRSTSEPSQGFGDSIGKLTKFFGIDPCGGCDKRRQVLNRVFPYRKATPAIEREPDHSLEREDLLRPSTHSAAAERGSIWIPNSRLQRPANWRQQYSDLISAYGSGQIDQRSNTALDARIQEIMASSGGRRDPDSRRGPLDLEGQRRSNRESSSGTQPAPGGTAPTTFACGVDVTSQMSSAIDSAKRAFAGWNNQDKFKACDGLTSWSTGSYAWDIIELHSQVTSDTLNLTFRPQCATSGASPPCGSSVTVDNSCHFAGSANYVIFGVMCRLCNSFFDGLLQQTNSNWDIFHDAVSNFSPRDIYRMKREDFSESGMLYLIDLYKKYVPLMTLDPVASNINAAKAWSQAGFYGWPNSGRPTPSGDRANCQLTCNQVTTVPLTVSWYPHLNAYSR